MSETNVKPVEDLPIHYMQYLELIKRMTSIAGRLNEIESIIGGTKRKWRDEVDLRLTKLEQHERAVKQDLSNCCNSPVKAVGGVTMHYECVKCGNACDIGGFDSKELVELDREKILYEIRMCTTTEGRFLGGMFAERMEQFGVPKANQLVELDENAIEKKLYEAKQAFGSELSYKTIAFIIAGNFGVPKKRLSVEEIKQIIKEYNDLLLTIPCSSGWVNKTPEQRWDETASSLHQRIYGRNDTNQ